MRRWVPQYHFGSHRTHQPEGLWVSRAHERERERLKTVYVIRVGLGYEAL